MLFPQHNPLLLPQVLGSVDCSHGRSIPTVLPHEVGLVVKTEAENQFMEEVFVQPKKVHEKMKMWLKESPSCNNFKSAISLTSCRRDCRVMKHAKPLEKDHYGDMQRKLSFRFRGGGAEPLQCFVCLVYKCAYVPKDLSDEYVTHCLTCGRGACNEHGSWEVGQFHCALCHGNDYPLLSGAKDTFAVRCLNKAFQKQKLLYRNEEAFHDFMLVLCAERTNRPMEATYTDEEFSDVQRQEAANTALTWEDAQQLVAAILLSRLGTAENVAKVLGQSWVPTWDGWKELQTCTTESCCVTIADRMCDIAQVNSPDRSMTDTQALRVLAAEGLMRQQAQSHGANNCLIDSLMLCLSDECILPENLITHVTARRCAAAACRKHLIQEVGRAVAPSRNGLFPYLDAHRDGPRIVAFLLQRFRAVARTNILIHVHDRFGECTVDPDRNKIFVHLGFEHPVQQALQLHIYNHTSVQGRGYHFDSLLRRMSAREAAAAAKRQAKIGTTILQGNKPEQKQENKAGSMSTRPCDNMDGTEQEEEQRAETVFTKMAWRICSCSFDTPWLEALVLNLCFHGYLSLGLSLDACQGGPISDMQSMPGTSSGWAEAKLRRRDVRFAATSSVCNIISCWQQQQQCECWSVHSQCNRYWLECTTRQVHGRSTWQLAGTNFPTL